MRKDSIAAGAVDVNLRARHFVLAAGAVGSGAADAAARLIPTVCSVTVPSCTRR